VIDRLGQRGFAERLPGGGIEPAGAGERLEHEHERHGRLAGGHGEHEDHKHMPAPVTVIPAPGDEAY
jgi:hypothetical protein